VKYWMPRSDDYRPREPGPQERVVWLEHTIGRGDGLSDEECDFLDAVREHCIRMEFSPITYTFRLPPDER
jgi:hypothetical protein